MIYHHDPKIQRLISELLDELCQHERNTGMRSTLIFIPHDSDQPGVIAHDGKPDGSDRDPGLALYLAIKERYRQ